jgi:uncharacterized metal-binding protein
MEPKEGAIYQNWSLSIMRTAEDSFERGANRVEEIRNFARTAGIRRIGIANCVSFSKEMQTLKDFFGDEFEVVSVDCKHGRISRKDMLGTEGSAIMCNPAGQARFLQDNQTELNISLGLCVGHDMVFNKESAVPVTNLVVKDRINRHNTLESIHSVDKEKAAREVQN